MLMLHGSRVRCAFVAFHWSKRCTNALIGLLVLYLSVSAGGTVKAANDPAGSDVVEDDIAVDFNRDILPILADRCFHCHGPDEEHREAGLRLDLADDDEGALLVIEPGDIDGSELWHRISTSDEELRMPPISAHKQPLGADEQELFRRWILEGAVYEKHWSFVTPRRAAAGDIEFEGWRRGRIDPYVAARLQEEGRDPKPAADKRTLIRRVTLDLTGLPPTVEQIDAFLRDDSPDAYEKLVDRLLEDEAYGEHMARYWADVVRLADTNGMHKDFFRDFSPYRAWLIQSFNDNLPFDEFITNQLAGDLFPEPSEDQLIASGFNRLHLIIDRGTALPEESHHKNVLDRVQAFGTAFLGLTVQCAQCHDHKYDPISQKEFYQLYAFFNNFDGEPETPGRPPNGIQAPSIELTGSRKGQVAMVMKERTEPKPTHVLVRGSYEHPGEQVERNTPAFLPPLAAKDGPYSRMDLALWLVDPAHPLTARVTVNRIWQQFFGVGLVKTSEDFGLQGERPSHPRLLDELAASFVESGWDVKTLVREIVLSQTYRQDSNASPEEFASDPDNRLLARGPRFRMDAEMIRDQILFVSGKLNRSMYGKSVKPPQPPGLWQSVTMIGERYKADEGDAIYRRSIYTFWKRGMPPPQMTILNAPSREFCTARRERTNTPLQALLLMNEPEYFRLAGACAELTRKEAGDDVGQGLALLYEKITSHEPSPDRLRLLSETLAAFRDLYLADESLADSLTSEMTEATHAQRADAAAWAMMAHSLLNLELAKVKR